jgi:tRNA nucleotidyltransferase (CCA-adding enzyme)
MDDVTLSLIRSHLQGLCNLTREHIALDLEKAYSQVRKPSEYFRLLADLGALEILYAPLAALRAVPAGPDQKRHGKSSAFDHTMEAIDRAKANGYGFGVFLAVLCHDFGKALTPETVLPHHYGHEERSGEIAREWFQQNRFRQNDAELAVAFAQQHMKVHLLEEMRPAKLIRFVRTIPQKYREDIFKAGNCDSPLNERQWQIARVLMKVLDDGIDSERLTRLKDEAAISSEVQRQHVENYRRLMAEVE